MSATHPELESAPLRVAVIGVGGMAHWQHLPNLGAMAAQARIVALVDVDEGRLASTAGAYGVANTYRSVDDLLSARLDLRAALVVTPPPQHAAPAIALLRAGIPVFCEKPLAYAEAEAEEIVRVAEETGVTFMVGFNRRFAATVRAAKETLAASPAELIVAEKCKPTDPASPYRLLENAVHALDTLCWLASGDVEDLRVLATADGDPSREQTVAALLRFAGGVTGSFAMNAHGAKWIERYEVYAREATVVVEYPVRLRRFTQHALPLSTEVAGLFAQPAAERELGQIDGEPILQLDGALYPKDEAVALGFRAELEHFFGCVRQGTVPLTSGRQALATQRLAYRIYRQAGLAMSRG